MEKKACGKKEVAVFDAFYKEFFGKSHIQIGYVLVGAIFWFLLVIMCCIPYQEMVQDFEDILAIVLIMGAGGSMIYMTAYLHAYDRKGAVVRIKPYLQYLPVSQKAWKEYLLWKFLKLQWKVYAVAQAGQILFALLAVHKLDWCNLLYPLLAAMVIPIVMFVTTLFLMEAK